MPLGTEVGLRPGDVVLDGHPAPPTDRGTAELLSVFKPLFNIALLRIKMQ